jgi:D-alanyl-D-alanine carboxypeptidase
VSTVPKVQALPAPQYQSGSKALANQPALAATSWVALDVDRNEIVLAHGDTDKRPIASLTKMMTGLLTAEAGNMAHPVSVSATAAGVEPNKDGLIIGNRYPRGILLYSAMLGSNNDAAAALGEDLGNGNYARYYKMMNARARELGMTDTRYGSSSGLNDATNWSTARDQAIILARALGNPTFAKAIGTWHHSVRWPDTGKSKMYENHNKMLQTFPGTIGGKTGFTTLAGGCLAVAVKRGGHTIVAVILHSNDIWGDMPALVNAAFKRSP